MNSNLIPVNLFLTGRRRSLTCANPNKKPTAHLQMNWQITFKFRKLVESHPRPVKSLFRVTHKRQMRKMRRKNKNYLTVGISQNFTNLYLTSFPNLSPVVSPGLVLTTQLKHGILHIRAHPGLLIARSPTSHLQFSQDQALHSSLVET